MEWNSGLRPPPPLRDNYNSTGESDISQADHPPNRTILALEAMLHMSDQLADRQSEVTPSETGPVGATGNEHVPPRTSKTELDTLAHFRRHAQKAGFSERVANYGSQIPQNRHEGHL